MRTTNFISGILASIASTSMVDAVAVNQVQQIPVSFAQAKSAGNAGVEDCFEGLKETNERAKKMNSMLKIIPTKDFFIDFRTVDKKVLRFKIKHASAIVKET